MAENVGREENEHLDLVEYLNHVLAEMKEQKYVKAALDLQALVFALSSGGKPKIKEVSDAEKQGQLN